MPKITFKNTGETVEVEDGASLMEVAQEKSWPIAFGCMDGMCGTCLVKISGGEGNLEPPDEKEQETLNIMGLNDGKHRLSCKCVVKGDLTIEV